MDGLGLMMSFRLNGHRRWALGIAGGVCAYAAVADWVCLPLYEHGIAQPLMVWLNGISAVLQFPAFTMIVKMKLREGHHTTTPLWFFGLLLTFLFYAIGVRILAGLYARLHSPARSAEPVRVRPIEALAAGSTPAPVVASTEPHTSRRRFLLSAGQSAIALGGATAAYAFLIEPRWFGISHHRVLLRDLPPELDRLRVVQLTDIHHGPTLAIDSVRQMVRATNALNPDLVLLTGDYVYTSPQYIEPVVRELAQLRARIGIVGVMGNHDWWEDPVRTRRAFAASGIPLIDNDRRFITPDRRLVRKTGEGLCIAGLGDYMEDVARTDEALAQVPAAMPRLLMSHNPDAAEDEAYLRERPRVDLMICGHTHGGQIWIPGLGTPIIPSRYGQKYASGFVDGPACKVFVSKGLGTTLLPMRFCVPPEIVAFDLRCA
jgi:predicted MPP superfamily phosphohydrolase